MVKIPSVKLKSVAHDDIKKVFSYYEELIADLIPIMTKRILVCSANDMLSQMVSKAYSWAVVERMHDVGRDRLLRDCDVVEVQHYDWALIDGTMDKIQDDAKLIQAIGLHLSPGGQIRCLAKDKMELRDLHAAIYNNGFRTVYQQDIGYIQEKTGGVYIYYAQNFSTVPIWLQQYYTKSIRCEIGFLLSRIDFDIDAEKSAARLKELCQEQNIQPNYLKTFIGSATINKEKAMEMLGMQVNL